MPKNGNSAELTIGWGEGEDIPRLYSRERGTNAEKLIASSPSRVPKYELS